MLTLWLDYYTELDGSDRYEGMGIEEQVQDVVKRAAQGIQCHPHAGSRYPTYHEPHLGQV